MMNIASHIIQKCGGHQAVAEMAGVDVTRVYRWTYPKERGGTGGVIPSKHQMALMQKARERGISLEPDDFFSVQPRTQTNAYRPTPESAVATDYWLRGEPG